jgi:hypothetical protein
MLPLTSYTISIPSHSMQPLSSAQLGIKNKNWPSSISRRVLSPRPELHSHIRLSLATTFMHSTFVTPQGIEGYLSLLSSIGRGTRSTHRQVLCSTYAYAITAVPLQPRGTGQKDSLPCFTPHTRHVLVVPRHMHDVLNVDSPLLPHCNTTSLRLLHLVIASSQADAEERPQLIEIHASHPQHQLCDTQKHINNAFKHPSVDSNHLTISCQTITLVVRKSDHHGRLRSMQPAQGH